MFRRREYLALFGSLVLIFLEAFVRVITLGLRMVVNPILYVSLMNRSATHHPFLLQPLEKCLQCPIFKSRKAVSSQEEVYQHFHSQCGRLRRPLHTVRILCRGARGADRRRLSLGATPTWLA